MTKLKTFISKKLLGTIVATAVILFGVPITPDMQAQLVAGLWALYIAIQGGVDAATRFKTGTDG